MNLVDELFREVSEKSIQYIKSLIKKTNNEPVITVSKNYNTTEAIKYIHFFHENKDKIQIAYSLLSDKDSMEIYRWLIKTRIAYAYLGNNYRNVYPYSLISGLKRNQFENITLPMKNDLILVGGYAIDSTQYLTAGTWVANEYMMENVCEPENGDVVISAGAYYGETTIWFADRVGSTGKVYAFEPSEIALNKLKRNIARNAIKNIEIIPKGVFSTNGIQKFLSHDETHNDANRIVLDGDNAEIETQKIDDFVCSQNISRIDFMKFDIEGAEYEALIGAENTILKFTPKLAICIYHKPEDLCDIIIYLHKLVPKYKFSISHKSPGFGETVLFVYKEN